MARQLITNQTFYDLYIVEKLTKAEILALHPMSEPTWHRYTMKADRMLLKDNTTDSLEQEILKHYNETNDVKDRKDYLKILVDIWKVKHKIPHGSKKVEIDFAAMLTGDPTEAVK